MWVVFLGNDYAMIRNILYVCSSKKGSIEKAAEYAFKNQRFSDKKSKEWFKGILISKLRDRTIAIVDFSSADFILYDHVGITLVPMGD